MDKKKVKSWLLAKKGELFKDPIKRHGNDIKRLILKGRVLTFLPPEIGQLSYLQELNLNSNQLTSFPAEIGQLSQLQELYLIDNTLSSYFLCNPVLCIIPLIK
ncbi:hypothetical protein DB41_GN00070 [Neochlamydia sp. TUME1]|uniref:hypothetical protein n=1 Tax=Neochlamydia sp. TUME1 TaxID=1478174 RepID=UPI00058383D5|nr:hypothetical protein [Neochlamydia sp. TUME1]KIC76097.1 hypothetical protein DB41_GN00070 [Neochlamydia sp. TUME1]